MGETVGDGCDHGADIVILNTDCFNSDYNSSLSPTL